MTKTVYQFDDNGYFLFSTEADESPLEPGVYLYPRNTTDCEPPSCSDTEVCRWNGTEWLVETVNKTYPIDTLAEFFRSYPDVYAYVKSKVEDKSKKHK